MKAVLSRDAGQCGGSEHGEQRLVEAEVTAQPDCRTASAEIAADRPTTSQLSRFASAR